MYESNETFNIEANDNKLRQQALKTLYIQATFRFK